MATVRWIGGADAVAQIAGGSIDTVDGTPANNTFTVTIGQVAISTAGDTDVATTAAALVALLNASTHPYFAAITWTNPSAGTITATADVAGVPFVAALTETGAGTGTVTDFSDTTAVAGPSCWSTAANWSGGTVPVNSDTVIFANGSAPLLYDLSTGLTSLVLDVYQSFTGPVGLNPRVFSQSADGATTDSDVQDYRTAYLTADLSSVNYGQTIGILDEGGPSRFNLSNTRGSSSTMTVHETATSSGPPVLQLLTAHADADIVINGAQGGVGIGTLVDGETGTIGDVTVYGESSVKVAIGPGMAVTNVLNDSEGEVTVRSTGTITLVSSEAGTVTLAEHATITALTCDGGTVYADHSGTITTATVTGSGTLNTNRTGVAKTITTLNHDGGSVIWSSNLTVTNYDTPAVTAGTRVTVTDG